LGANSRDLGLVLKGLSLHQSRPDKHWSLTDCISFVVMQDRAVQQALAFDYHFEQAGFEALLRRDPT
jgi:predicted nucleic acid-binding protein